MKSIILVACLILSASAAPGGAGTKSAGLEQESQVRSEKLQFTPSDAQVYSSALPVVAGGVIPSSVSAVDRVITGNVAVPQVVSQYTPGYYTANGVPVVNDVVYPGSVPYYSAGRSTITTTPGLNGLPANTVYEHHGQTHIGHAATAVHIRRPGQWLASPQYYAGGLVSGAVVPTHHIPAHLYNNQLYHGQIQYINGQQAQNINGQWYYVNPAAIGNPLVNQYPSVYTNLRGNIVPTLTNGGRTLLAPVSTYGQSVLGLRPVIQDNKWYTKTNTQQVASPFWSTAQVAAPSGVKTLSVSKIESDAEKADW